MQFAKLSQILIDDIDKWLPIYNFYVENNEVMTRRELGTQPWEYIYHYDTYREGRDRWDIWDVMPLDYLDFFYDDEYRDSNETNRAWYRKTLLKSDNSFCDLGILIMFSYSPRPDDVFLVCFQIVRYYGYHDRKIGRLILDLFPKPSLED